MTSRHAAAGVFYSGINTTFLQFLLANLNGKNDLQNYTRRVTISRQNKVRQH